MTRRGRSPTTRCWPCSPARPRSVGRRPPRSPTRVDAEQAERERAEEGVLDAYLPQQMSDEDLAAAIVAKALDGLDPVAGKRRHGPGDEGGPGRGGRPGRGWSGRRRGPPPARTLEYADDRAPGPTYDERRRPHGRRRSRGVCADQPVMCPGHRTGNGSRPTPPAGSAATAAAARAAAAGARTRAGSAGRAGFGGVRRLAVAQVERDRARP